MAGFYDKTDSVLNLIQLDILLTDLNPLSGAISFFTSEWHWLHWKVTTKRLCSILMQL